jgi:ornithine decarboxylase
MEESQHVLSSRNKVIFSPAIGHRISNNSSDHAVDYCFNNFNNKEYNQSEDDATSCASDYDSSSTNAAASSDETKSIGNENSGVSNLSLNDNERINNPGPKNNTSYHVDFDLSREVGQDIYDITDLKSVAKFAHSQIESGKESESFLITNLAVVVNQYHLWKSELPMVHPFYAVKCNPDVAIVRLLAALGCGFDCATEGEIDLVLHGLGEDLSFGPRGLASANMVYANPAHMSRHLTYAINHGVRMTVFDSEDELEKIASLDGHEHLQLLLRLTTDDRASICQFSRKFGCPVRDAPHLLHVAKSLGLNVVGVSFHVGSGCGDANAYVIALDHARQVFDSALSLGMKPLTVIDIGGGFPGDSGGYGGPNMPTFQDLAAAVRAGIKNFSIGLKRPISDIRFIAEPGRFFASACTSVVTKVYARKGGHGSSQALYVDDGVYGTFNNIVYDHATPVPMKLATLVAHPANEDENLLPTVVFGPTCDGLDQLCSMEKTRLPRCEVDDWLLWDNMGAYTHTASFLFNGYTHIPKRRYCYLEHVQA